MAREISYDVRTVRAEALAAFFAKGFSATSLVDLEAATGLNRRQLYNGFGDKRALFLTVFDEFANTAPRVFLAELHRQDADLNDIATVLRRLAADADSPRGRLGCLVCNTARETIANDDDVQPRVQAFFRYVEGLYGGAVENARDLGQISHDRDPTRLARFLLGIHVTICVLARSGESGDVIRDFVEEALIGLTP